MNLKKIAKLQKAKDYAISRGGVCLSQEYKNNKEKLLWKCSEENHPVWQASYDNCINKNSWCIHCSGKLPKPSKEGIQEAQLYAQSKGGKCLSMVYESRQKKLEWKCHNPEHKSWLAPTDTVIYKKTWCKECGFEQQKITKKNKVTSILNL